MGKTVLTVDDSVSTRQMVSFTLKSAGPGPAGRGGTRRAGADRADGE